MAQFSVLIVEWLLKATDVIKLHAAAHIYTHIQISACITGDV